MVATSDGARPAAAAASSMSGRDVADQTEEVHGPPVAENQRRPGRYFDARHWRLRGFCRTSGHHTVPEQEETGAGFGDQRQLK
jgi:hypothetical protein